MFVRVRQCFYLPIYIYKQRRVFSWVYGLSYIPKKNQFLPIQFIKIVKPGLIPGLSNHQGDVQFNSQNKIQSLRINLRINILFEAHIVGARAFTLSFKIPTSPPLSSIFFVPSSHINL